MNVNTPYVYFLAALMPLLLPLDWLSAAVTAGVFHETCHLLMLFLCGGKAETVNLRIGGCEIKTSTLGYWQQVLCILAGPLGSLSLLFSSRLFPKLAVCGLIHGAYNLIPVYPLDGGRVLQMLLYRFWPSQAARILKWFAICTCAGILFLAMWACFAWNLGIGAIFCGILLIMKLFLRKTPCKPSEIGVQ